MPGWSAPDNDLPFSQFERSSNSIHEVSSRAVSPGFACAETPGQYDCGHDRLVPRYSAHAMLGPEIEPLFLDHDQCRPAV